MPMSKTWSPFAVVTLGVVVWIAGSAIIDWLVLQVYPLPPGLWGNVSMRGIIATRPNAAVALNLAGELVLLSIIAFAAPRLAGAATPRAGVWVTGIVVVLAVTNSLLTANLRWVNAIGFLLFLFCGVSAARRSAVTLQRAATLAPDAHLSVGPQDAS